jgi:hypothetical protein
MRIPGDWPKAGDLKPFEGSWVRIEIEHPVLREWADNGIWEGVLVNANADWWTCLLRLDDGALKFLDVRKTASWEAV